jgi:hypothetical protein
MNDTVALVCKLLSVAFLESDRSVVCAAQRPFSLSSALSFRSARGFGSLASKAPKVLTLRRGLTATTTIALKQLLCGAASPPQGTLL